MHRASPSGARRRILARSVRWTLLGVAVVMLTRFMRDGWPEVTESLSALTAEQAPFVAFAVLVETIWVGSMAQVYRSALMAFGGAVSRWDVLRISMAAFTVSRIVPGGGAAGGAVAVRELIAAGNPAFPTIASMLASWWVTMTGLSALVLAGIALSASRGTLAVGYMAAPAAAFAAGVIGGVVIALAMHNRGLRERLSESVARGAVRMGHAESGVARPASTFDGVVRIRGLLAVFGWGLAVWVSDAAALWFSLAAFGWRVDVGVLLVAFGLANLIQALPELTPGWLGVLEVSVAMTLTALGVPAGIAVAGVLLYRLLSYWLPTAVGMPIAIQVLRGSRRASTSGREAEARP